MVRQIEWPYLDFDEVRSPFQRGEHERPLRVTLHTSSFVGMPPNEQTALDVLRQVARLPEIEVTEIASESEFARMDIGTFDRKAKYIPVRIYFEDNRSQLVGVDFPAQLPWTAANILESPVDDSPEVLSLVDELLCVRAHGSIRNDVFVTLSPRLLNPSARSHLHRANIMSPSEAAKIVGLFLHSRGRFTLWEVRPGSMMNCSSNWFYQTLARLRLPHTWRYASACYRAQKIRNDDIAELGGSFLRRCIRALQARDAIGESYCVPQDHDMRSKMIYHFDYLMLLLAGAFDAAARIAHRVYKIEDSKEHLASFRKKAKGGDSDLLKELKKKRAIRLYDLISEQHTQALLTMCFELRNTIHGASLSVEQRSPEEGDDERSFIEVLQPYEEVLWEKSQFLGPPEEWGLQWERIWTNRDRPKPIPSCMPEAGTQPTRPWRPGRPDWVLQYNLLLEPYAYAVKLVSLSFDLLDAIAEATEVERLFDGQTMPELNDGPPQDEFWSDERHVQHVDVLG